MNKIFKTIGLIGLPRKTEAMETHFILYEWLSHLGFDVLVEESLSSQINKQNINYAPLDLIGKTADLVIVVGGDGNMLRAARALADFDVRIIGINKGNLGFLTEINPNTAKSQLSDVLNGNFVDEQRLILEIGVYSKTGEIIDSSFAVNEIVVHSSKIAHMIAYEAYIDQQQAFMQRADGLIISTPTGSTAYSLSAGGPILSPSLDAMIITPMFPHSLSARPLVIKSDCKIDIKFPPEANSVAVTCDSQVVMPINPTDYVVIKKSKNQLKLIHSRDYDYFKTLSTKLSWAKALF